MAVALPCFQAATRNRMKPKRRQWSRGWTNFLETQTKNRVLKQLTARVKLAQDFKTTQQWSRYTTNFYCFARPTMRAARLNQQPSKEHPNNSGKKCARLPANTLFRESRKAKPGYANVFGFPSTWKGFGNAPGARTMKRKIGWQNGWKRKERQRTQSWAR